MKFFLLLSAIGFCWAQYSPHTQEGRTSIVHLFEWRWVDIALECERYLAPNGFGGVQVSPPNENIVIDNPFRPWWERYQPVSYKLCTRSGNEDEFKNMVTRCNNVGVRIYVDAVINHMTGSGASAGTGSTCGSYFDPGNRNFPEVPYSAWDFNDGKCQTASGEVENYNDAYQVRDCRLVGLLDLALEKDYVRSMIADYLNHLIDIGVAGFRLDAAKHMWPGDIKEVLDKKVIVREYINVYIIFFNRNWGEGWSFMPSDRALVFVDNHDNQRGHGAGGASILTFWDSRLYKMAVGFMLAHPYGLTRVMSSYRWPRQFENGNDVNDWVGPPNNNGVTKEVTINEDTTCGNDWVCEHRWRQISDEDEVADDKEGEEEVAVARVESRVPTPQLGDGNREIPPPPQPQPWRGERVQLLLLPPPARPPSPLIRPTGDGNAIIPDDLNQSGKESHWAVSYWSVPKPQGLALVAEGEWLFVSCFCKLRGCTKDAGQGEGVPLQTVQRPSNFSFCRHLPLTTEEALRIHHSKKRAWLVDFRSCKGRACCESSQAGGREPFRIVLQPPVGPKLEFAHPQDAGSRGSHSGAGRYPIRESSHQGALPSPLCLPCPILCQSSNSSCSYWPTLSSPNRQQQFPG
ncbi:PREDICTED: alpha-amylase 2B [Propithecus coquereli]|uniref:alpha-amylase 2B n=1 Tax=Propithecus coquereli TaxID=379532 RepID=UPI00063F3033|nr:PREDICTED: alpha-amylase 2B [Propithecus coquereli]